MPAQITKWLDLQHECPEGATHFQYRKPTDDRARWREGPFRFALNPETLDRAPVESSGTWCVQFYGDATTKTPIAYPSTVGGKVRKSRGGGLTELQVQFIRGLPDSPTQHEAITHGVYGLLENALTHVNSGNAIIAQEVLHLRDERNRLSEALEELRPGTLQFLIENHASEIFALLGGIKDGMIGMANVLRSVPAAQVASFQQVYQQMAEQQKQFNAELSRLAKEREEDRREVRGTQQLMAELLAEMRHQRDAAPKQPEPVKE